MSVPKYSELYGPLLKTLEDGKAHSMKDIKQSVIKCLNLTEVDLMEMLPSGKQSKFDNRIGWARTYLKKAGLIESPSRSILVLTAEGKKVIHDADIISDSYLKKYRSFRIFRDLEDDYEE